jgi:toxin-antitoxin system PIN domain toxin
MRHLPDVNIWIALSIPAHTHHRKALEWFEQDTGNMLYFCRYTQQGSLRLMTTKAVTALFGQPPLSNRAALRAMSDLLDHERISFADEPASLFPKWAHYADVATPSPKLWMDAYLAAFARTGGFSVVTTDKAFKQFEGLNAVIL